jgi:hypothetical protein
VAVAAAVVRLEQRLHVVVAGVVVEVRGHVVWGRVERLQLPLWTWVQHAHVAVQPAATPCHHLCSREGNEMHVIGSG